MVKNPLHKDSRFNTKRTWTVTMTAADYLFLVLRKPVVSGILTRDSLPALTGLTPSEISSIVDTRIVAPSLHDLERCRAAAFGLDAGLSIAAVTKLVSRRIPWSYSEALVELAWATLPALEADPAVQETLKAIVGVSPTNRLESRKAA